jgi:hypothetical protein
MEVEATAAATLRRALAAFPREGDQVQRFCAYNVCRAVSQPGQK